MLKTAVLEKPRESLAVMLTLKINLIGIFCWGYVTDSNKSFSVLLLSKVSVNCSAWSRSQVQNLGFGPKENTRFPIDQRAITPNFAPYLKKFWSGKNF